MITYQHLSECPRRFLALTGFTPTEFRDLLPAFEQAYLELYPARFTLQGQPRRRAVGAGRHSRLGSVADKLLFLLVYLKTYPLQAVLGEMFGLSTTRANYWLQCLLPVLQKALDSLGVLPEREGQRGACQTRQAGESKRLIVDATERRRQRPKNPEKQALHYSGKKKTHTDKNVLVVNASSRRVLYLGTTHAGSVHEKRIVDQEPIAFPPDTTLYKDAGFQGYEPPVARTCQAKKKDEATSAHGAGEADQSEIGPNPRPRRTCRGRGQKKSHREGYVPQYQRGHV
jgi:DDE superfamily endonuclease/Helix-turn-helix of DDE superfamily endonuclease